MEEEISNDKQPQQQYTQDNSDSLSTSENSTASKQNYFNQDGPNGIGSSSSLTYYYSSFDLFENQNDAAFLKYRRFIKKLQHYLGPDWIIYANQVCYQENLNGQRLYLNNQLVFELCLEIWLQMRREFNKERKNIGQTTQIYEDKSMKESEMSVEDGHSSQIYQEDQEISKLQEITFSMFEENEYFEQFSKKFQAHLINYKIGNTPNNDQLFQYFKIKR